MNRLRSLFLHHWNALISLHDTPHSIAGAVAIGVFFGFTPLFGFKTLLAILLAWVFRCSCVAAAVAVNLHDVTIPLAPVILRVEYGIGYFLLNRPHVWPPQMRVHPHFETLLHWSSFVRIGWPMLVGSVVFSAPFAVIFYFISLKVVTQFQAKRAAAKAEEERKELVNATPPADGPEA